MKRTCLLAAALALAALAYGDWPQYLGPRRDGVSTETVTLADSWPEDGPKVAWKLNNLGTGYAGAVVEGGKAYVLDRVNDEKDVLRCIDLETGKEEWTFSYDCPGKYQGNYNGSRNQGAVDDKYVFTLGPFGHVTCVSKETHQAVWQHNLVEDFGAVVSNWGLCQSPAMYRNTVIVQPLTDKAGVVAYDKDTGSVAWQSERIGTYCWTSPLVATIDGVDQVVVLSTRDNPKLTGLDAATGKVLWSYKGWEVPNAIASPEPLGDGRFFLTGGYGAGSALVKVSKKGEEWQAEEVFKTKECGSQGQNAIFYKGFIYAHSSDTKSDVMCLGLDGTVKWKTPGGNPEEIGGILIADGKIFSLLSEKGVLRMIAATPDGYKELAQAKVTGGANIWGPLAYSDGRLLLRNKRTLICLDLRAAK